MMKLLRRLLLLSDLVSRLEGGGQVHEALDLDAVAGTHVRDVVEVGRRGNQLGASIGVPAGMINASLLTRCKFGSFQNVKRLVWMSNSSLA
jgi:hypothetical protein